MRDRRKKPRMGDDRRNNDRVFAKLDITTIIEDKEVTTEMRNLSGNGMQIIEPAEFELKTDQECQVLLSEGNTSIKLDAKVVWKEFGLIGLCFKKQNQLVQKQINKLSQKLSMVALTDEGISGLV